MIFVLVTPYALNRDSLSDSEGSLRQKYEVLYGNTRFSLRSERHCVR